MKHLDHIQGVVDKDISALQKAEKEYGGSWKKRGGIGAFMMLARKWDRIERQLEQDLHDCPPYEIFEHIQEDPREEGLIDDIRDLRRYLILVEAEIEARKDAPLAGVALDDIPLKIDTGKADKLPRKAEPFGYKNDV